MPKLPTICKGIIALLPAVFLVSTLYSQQLKITDFVLFGGQSKTSKTRCTDPGSQGYSVNLASATTINNGRIGSFNLIQSNGATTLNCTLNSGGTINLANSAKVSGSITAQNNNNASGNILKMGYNAYAGNNIDVAGNIYISSGAVVGNITHPAGTTYYGPKPGGKELLQTPTIPTLSQMPAVTNFASSGTKDIVYSCTITPGNYRDMKLNGNQLVVFSGPGDYYFRSIYNRNNNNLQFDFKNALSGNIRIFVVGDVDLGKNASALKNGGAASRIFLETHGNGSNCSIKKFSFCIANGTGNGSSWLGTVWAPYASINIGAGFGSSVVQGALWSNAQVNIQCGATINFAAFNSNAGDTLIVPGYQPPANGKSTDLIGPELASLCATYNSLIAPSTDIYRIVDGKIYVEIITNAGYYNSALTKLRDVYGMTDFVDNGPNTQIITGAIPIAQLCLINNDADLKTYINSCRPVYAPISSEGVTTTQGDTALNSFVVRNAFHLTGEGIKVGVLSDGFNTIPGDPADVDVQNGDLPGIGNPTDSTPVDVVQDYPYGRTTDEGRAMLQIVHDMAPKATLAFRTGFISEGDFAQGIQQLQQHGCKVIADDITYITTPFFKDGLAAQAVNNVKAKGVSYFSAAGNFGAESYAAVFNPTAAPNGVTGQAHNFGNGDIFQNDSLAAGNYTIVMQWEDSIYSLGQGGAQNDFDIYLVGDDGSILFGMNRNNLGGDPIEVLPFTVKANTRTNIMIVRAAGSTPNVRIKFIVYRGNLKFNEYSSGTSTLIGQANATGAMAVAAARYTQTPAYGVNPAQAETFSSVGGTAVYGIVRNKPDFTAVDGVNTTVNFSSLDIEKDNIPNFFGTSAAAPHAAAVAALILEGKSKFYNKDLEPDSVRIILSNTASDMSTPGFDDVSGYGLIQADAAVGSFAAPTPELDSLIITSPATSIPGRDPVNITLRGKYFKPTTTVTLRGVTITTTIVNSTTATATVNSFAGNPPISMFTTPITPSGLDGLYSDSLYFFSQIKKKILITADNQTKKYGERIPDFTSTILVDGKPLSSSGLALADLNLDTINYTTPAKDTSNVGLYFIRPSFKSLSHEDSLAFELYDYTFKDGILFINKMPLVITPRDTAITYGTKIGGLKFNYSYGDSLIPVNERQAFLSNISAVHNASIDTTAVAFVDGKTIINGRTLAAADLLNMSVMASGKSIINGRNIINGKTIVNGVTETDTTKVVDLALQSIFNYQLDSSSSPLVSAKNIVNARTIINGKSIINGTAVVDGKTIVNGKTIINSSSVGDTSNSNVVIIIDQDDVTEQTNVLSDIRSVNMITGLTPGNSFIVPAALISENFDVSYDLGNLNILPASLIVKANDTLIYQGDKLPAFTSTITGLRNQDSILSGPTYTVSPLCIGNAGKYSIIPSNVVTGCADCYITTYTPGTLYVNPKGWYARNLKSYLICVDTLINDPTGLKYVANFGCTNSNKTAVYIPAGANNYLSGAGASTSVGALPEIFQPGNGNNFQIKFNGNKIVWALKSYCGYQKVTVMQDASSCSKRCKSSGNSSSATQEIIASGKSNVMPNPTTGKFIITVDNGEFSNKGIYIVDETGRKYLPQNVNKMSSTKMQLELPAKLTKGVYYVNVKVNDVYKIFKVIKL